MNGIEFVKKGYPIIVLQTFSKIFGLAGIRVGYGLASAEIIDCIQKVREPFNVNTLAQVAAEAALKDTDHVTRSRNCVAEGREQLYQIFDQLRLIHNSSFIRNSTSLTRNNGLTYTRSDSNFILVEVGEQAEEVYFQLIQRGIIVRYGELWGLPHHLRITVGTQDENRALGQALQQILE